MKSQIAIIMATLGLTAEAALAQHTDILAYSANGAIQVNQIDVDTAAPADPPTRVFSEAFSGSAGTGYSTSAPGWNTIASFPLPANKDLGFTIVPDPIIELNLAYWDGSGAVSFSAPEGGAGLIISKGVGPGMFYESVARGTNDAVPGYIRTATTSSPPMYSPSLGNVIDRTSASGTIHRHLGFLLRAGDDLVRYDLDPAPPDGIYLLPLKLHIDTLADSDVFWIVFGLNASTGTRDQAVQWVRDHLETALPGDADLDGDVDLADLGALATYYGTAGGVSWAQGDFDHDNDVDLTDLGALATHYNGGQDLALTDFQLPIALPEPNVALIAFGVALAMLQSRGKRGALKAVECPSDQSAR